MAAVSEDYVGHAFIAADCRVYADVCKCCESAVHGELRTSHVEGTDGRVMADLFIVDRNAFDGGLKGLPKNGVEWFLHE